MPETGTPTSAAATQGDPVPEATAERAKRVPIRLSFVVIARWAPFIGICAVVIAVALRLFRYFADPSISLDEAALALNVVARPYGQLLHELDFNQGAPAAFLLLEKASIDVFGDSERALRLPAVVAGIAAAALIVPLARRMLADHIAKALAAVLFGTSATMILYSATAKPYELDAALAIALYLIAARVERHVTVRGVAVLAAAGVVAPWFSFASVFVLAGIGLTLLTHFAFRRRWRDFTLLAGAAAAWLVSFVIVYFVSVRNLTHLRGSFAGDSEAVGGEDTVDTLRTASGAARSILGVGELHVAGLEVGRAAGAVALLTAMAGLAFLARNRPINAAMLTLPALFTLIAAKLNFYPLFPRTVLFLAPALVLLLAYGVSQIVSRRHTRLLGIAVAAVVAAAIVIPGAKTFARPQRLGDLKPALRYLASHQRTDDTLWVHQPAQYELRYYLACGCYGSARTVAKGASLWPLVPAVGGAAQFAPALKSVPPRFFVSDAARSSSLYRSELESLRGRSRVWILLAEAQPARREAILSFLDTIGERVAMYQTGAGVADAGVFLYDLSRH
jgi:Dolichyl-phosphate-mannose-protein mannosyltransferase